MNMYQAIVTQPEMLISEEIKLALDKAIRELPEDQQRILHLYFTEQLSIRKIAAQSRCSVTPVRQRLFKAIYILKKQFNPQYFEKANQILFGNL